MPSPVPPAHLPPLSAAARRLQLDPDLLEPYGREVAKVPVEVVEERWTRAVAGAGTPRLGRLVLVTAVTPTRAGEGKTTIAIGLADALNRLGVRASLALREPSLGPTLGQKGGAAGGGLASLVPEERINLHFTGDLHAVTAANNFLAALIDNSLHFGNPWGLDPRRITFHRVLDMNDRALRRVVIGLGGPANGVPREETFQITGASEVMAALCLADSYRDLRQRLGEIVVGWTPGDAPVRADALGAADTMTRLLHHALQPNLVQTRFGSPALVHGGPFGNIAHGTNSILATRLALTGSDYAVTEAGFGADLGAEKFVDLVAPVGGFYPSVVVLVVTRRTLEAGGPELLERHLRILRPFEAPVVVAVNRFPGDTPEGLSGVLGLCDSLGVPAALTEVYQRGPEGGEALARLVLAAGQGTAFRPAGFSFYPRGQPVLASLEALARQVYGATGVRLGPVARQDLELLARAGLDRLPVCVAKTPYSLADDPDLGAVPRDPWELWVRELQPRAGAGYVVALAGEILAMPGLPRNPRGVSPSG